MQRETVVELIVIQQVLPDAVNNQVQEFVFLVEEEGDGEVSNLFFRVFGRRDEVDGFEVSEIDVPSENVYV